jgi:hypothetical protein
MDQLERWEDAHPLGHGDGEPRLEGRAELPRAGLPLEREQDPVLVHLALTLRGGRQAEPKAGGRAVVLQVLAGTRPVALVDHEQHLEPLAVLRQRRAGPVEFAIALSRKRPPEGQYWSSQRIFPSTPTFLESATDQPRRHHLPEIVREHAMREAARASEIPKRAGCYTCRRSFATHRLMHVADLWPLQELSGHVDASTTLIDIYALGLGSPGVRSPLNRLAHLLRVGAEVGYAGLPNAAEVPRGDSEEQRPAAPRLGGAG